MQNNSLPSESNISSSTGQPLSHALKFPIVCLGASAGGLEAFEQFLRNIPENSGMAYIVIQHLDPTQKGMLPELLQRVTPVPVFEAKNKMQVKPDCVYVIPPNKSMSILKSVLYLFKPIETRGLRLPIDFFLRSLADDQQENGIGIILSGMGSDGSAGVRALKEQNGIVLVQEPTDAKFDSMPLNAIDSVLPDIIAPASELPVKLMSFINHLPLVKSNIDTDYNKHSSLDKIIIILRSQTGNDFSLYKKNTLYRRIERRMSIHKLDKIAAYVRFLQENPKEVEILFKELLIGVTNFFRDPAVWEKIKEKVIPAIISEYKNGTTIRAWVPGCSTGEEAYSLAIVFKEVIERINPQGGFSMQIFATDLDNEAIETGRKGLYPYNINADVSAQRLSRFFTPTEDGYRINTEIREMVVFAKHNLILHPPFTKLDILTCRNLLIYLDAELQKKILGLFYYSLNPNGFMVLGSAETLGAQGIYFTTIDAKFRVYQRAVVEHAPSQNDFPSSFSRIIHNTEHQKAPVKIMPNIQLYADQLIIQHFSPPGVLVSDKGDIIYISGSTGKYLEPAVGKANMNIFAMLREGLRQEFPAAFRQAIVKNEKVVLKNLKLSLHAGATLVNITIEWINKPEALKGMLLIVFNEVAGTQRKKGALKKMESSQYQELEKELQHAREEMQNTLEEMQTSQEELKSTIEELQSTNEELQSTNEELTTSKEEMQSLNEELQTVNAELQSKVDEFSLVKNDMKNLLDSTEIATLFLDKDLNIRRYTPQATKIFKLIKTDIGRPFTDQVSDLIYPDVVDDALQVLHTLVFIQKQIATKDGRWFSTRIMPYRTLDDRIDGLVITFFNISEYKHRELDFNEKGQFQNLILNLSGHIIIQLSADWRIIEFNESAERYFGRKKEEVLNKNYFHVFIPETLQKKSEREFIKLLKEEKQVFIKSEIVVIGGNSKTVELDVHVLLDSNKMPIGLMLTTKVL